MSVFREIGAIRDCVSLVENAGLLGDLNECVNLPYNYVAQARGLQYKEYWSLHKRNFWFHIKLCDEGLILFEDTSFRFIMSPISIPTMDDFINYEMGSEWDLFTDDDKYNYVQSENFKNSYENFIETTSDYKNFTPIRLDQHPKQHKVITHPAHHLHIGYENESRIPVKRVLTPLAFTAFILSTFYPDGWEKLHTDGHVNEENICALKSKLSMIGHIDQELWDATWEENRLYLI
ncbi:DUF2290 domain-containing protein [Serratia fonticola]|uniref:DUF2290 domain-containing protein n=1 Tax=Serratia fonticola TaxID=47917 RepID=UPI003AADBFAF